MLCEPCFRSSKSFLFSSMNLVTWTLGKEARISASLDSLNLIYFCRFSYLVISFWLTWLAWLALPSYKSILLRYWPWITELGGLLHCCPYCCLFWLSKASSSSNCFFRVWKLLLHSSEFFLMILIYKSSLVLPPFDWICSIFFLRFSGMPLLLLLLSRFK